MINTQKNRVTICACASRPWMDKEKLIEVAATLQEGGYEVTIVPDLCQMAMQQSPALEAIASSVIVACYPRTIRSLFDTVQKQPLRMVDLRTGDLPHVLGEFTLPTTLPAEVDVRKEAFRERMQSFSVETGADAWYPVIDKERCCDCGKCHDFCLFGVYTLEGGEVKVSQPQNCKNNCPACARMCPMQAVIFPKYEKSPINGGLQQEEEAVSVDPKIAYAHSLRARLEQRKAGISFIKPNTK